MYIYHVMNHLIVYKLLCIYHVMHHYIFCVYIIHHYFICELASEVYDVTYKFRDNG